MNQFYVKCRNLLNSKLSHLNKLPIDPTDDFYNDLGGSDLDALQKIVDYLSERFQLTSEPQFRFDLSIKFQTNIAGLYNMRDHEILVPVRFAGFPKVIGGIIAHEMAHAILTENELNLINRLDNERLTDFTTIYVGLGKLLLNGKIVNSQLHLPDLHIFGYLSPQDVALLFRRQYVGRLDELQLKEYLTYEARRLLG